MDQNGNECTCKVGRVMGEFGLTDLNDELVTRRKGTAGDEASLRDLTGFFNRAVLRRAIENAGESPLQGEVENIYRLLTDDDVSSGMRVRARKRLERDGVDVEAVEDSVISHPTMGTHLKDCLGVQRSETAENRVENARERIFKMQTRAERVIESALQGLVRAGYLAGGSLAVSVDLQVSCEECGAHAGVARFIEREGCDCEPDG